VFGEHNAAPEVVSEKRRRILCIKALLRLQNTFPATPTLYMYESQCFLSLTLRNTAKTNYIIFCGHPLVQVSMPHLHPARRVATTRPQRINFIIIIATSTANKRKQATF
jgi:hypothetical protein